MRDEMSMLDADESQFSTFTMKSKKGTATREKVNWREKDHFPRLVTVVSGGGVGGTLGGRERWSRAARAARRRAPQHDQGRRGLGDRDPGGRHRLDRQGRRLQGRPAWAASDVLLITSNAHPQGADFPDTAILLPTLGYNYTQIFRHGWSFSRTARAVDYYGRGEPADEQAEKGLQHKRAIEYSGFFGPRAQTTDALTGEPVGIAGGLVEFITTNVLDAGAVYAGEAAGDDHGRRTRQLPEDGASLLVSGSRHVRQPRLRDGRVEVQPWRPGHRVAGRAVERRRPEGRRLHVRRLRLRGPDRGQEGLAGLPGRARPTATAPGRSSSTTARSSGRR